MVMLLEMTVGKVFWLLALFAATTFANNLTCTDLSWENNAVTLRNAGNHILVLSSMRLDCFGDDKRFEYTNNSVLLNPGQNMELPSDPWMYNCSATFCSACLIYQCNIITQLNPDATLTFLYNTSGLVDFSGVGYAHRSHVRTKKVSNQVVAVCPKDMVSIWTKNDLPTALIDIPNRKKKKTIYTVTLKCNGSYLWDKYGNATESFTLTTPVKKSRADVIITVPLQELGETPRTCMLDACLHRKRFCRQKVLCRLTIPDNSVVLKKFNKWKKTRYRTVGCSQTKWVWSVTDQQTGDLHIRLWNKDWKEKSFVVSVRCRRLTVLNNSLLVTVPPIVYTKLVTFPLKISALNSSAKSTKCVIKLCNTAKKKCGRNTKCIIRLPVNNGKFMTTLFNITDNDGQCGSKAVTWSPQGTQRGTLSVKLQNAEQETVTATASVNCSGLEVLQEQWNLTVELPPNSQEYAVEFKLKPTSIDSTAVETYCTVNICNAKGCGYLGESCNTTIPVKDGLFTDNEDGNTLNMNNETDNNSTDNCESKSVTWSPQGTRRGLLSIQLVNSRQIAVTAQVLVNCTELEVIKDEWNRTFRISANSLHTAAFKMKPKISVDLTVVEASCTIKTCNRKDCRNQEHFCSSSIKIPIKDGLFLEINNTGKFESKSISWSKQGIRRGTLSIQLQNAKQNAVLAEVSVNCSGLEVVDGEWNKTVKIPTSSLDITEFRLRPTSTLDDDAVETYCTVKFCDTEDCENQKESHDIAISVKDGTFPDDTGIFTNEAIWALQGTRRGTLSVELQNTKQKGITAEITVNCSGLEIVNREWNKTVRVTSDSERTIAFRLRPTSTLDYAAVETNCTIVIDRTDNNYRPRVSNVRIPVKNGLFPDENSTNNTDIFRVDSVVWSQQGSKRGVVSVQLDNSKPVTVIAEVTVICAGLEVVKEQWNLTVNVHKNSQRVVEFKIKPSINIDLTAVETYCTVNVCNREDCKNQGESHNVTIPIKKGEFSSSKPGCDSTVIWQPKGPQRVIVSVRLQNSGQKAVSIQVTVVCSELEVVKNFWNVTSDVAANSLYNEQFKLKPKDSIDVTTVEADCTVTTCNTEDCLKDGKSCSYDITIPIKNGLFPEAENKIKKRETTALCPSDVKNGLFPEAENKIKKRETTALCPSDVVFFNQSSSDFPIVFVIVRNTKKNALPFIIEIICNNIYVFQDNGTLSGSVIKRIPSIQPKAQKVVEFRFQNNSNRAKTCSLDICVERKAKCSSVMSCGYTFFKNITLIVSDLDMPSMTTVPTTDAPTTTPVSTTTITPVPTTSMSATTPMPTTDASTMTPVPTEEQHADHRACTQKDAVWVVNQPLRGVMKVKAYNLEQEEIEATVTLQCSSFLQPVNDRITDTITIPGGSLRSVKFRFLVPNTDTIMDAEEPDEAQCVINICPHHDCTLGMNNTCIIRMPMKDGGFVIVKPARKKDNETKYISHKCHDEHDIHSPAPCHDKMWNLVYTSAQLEGEALLTITLNLKPNNQVDLRTNVSLKCEGIIIEDDAQKILIISKYESQRNISFAFATIRSLHLERHTCTLSIQHSLLIASTDNITDDAMEKLCLNGEKCYIAIDSRLGRIIPKCNLSQVKSLINHTSVDQNSAKVIIGMLPSVYGVFSYEAHCSKNNPFAYDPVHEKKMNAFVSEPKETKVITVEYAPDCDNDTIRTEYENYRKDDCNFLLYGYCQGGELLLEKFVNILFDHDNMYCTPKLLFNKWLQTIQKHTGIHSKPLAAILAVFIVIIILLILIILPIVIVVYCCCCRRHRDNAKRPSVGIVISSCDEWEETNAMLNAMSVENSKFLTARSYQQIHDKKFPITDDLDLPYDSFDSLSSDYEDVGSPIYQLDSGKAGQDDYVDQEDSAIYHDPEDHHHHHKHIDQHGACACDPTTLYTAQLELEAAIEQLDVINESIPEQYSNLSVTRTDFSSPLHGWGDEDGDTGELLKSTNY